MTKIKYRAILDTLRNIKPEDNIKHQTISNILDGNPSANALANRFHNDGYLEEVEIKKLEKKYNYDFLSNSFISGDVEISDDILLDYYPEVYASCGTGAEPFSTRSEKMNVSKSLIKGYDSHKRYNVINTTSDSMLPEIAPKDFLIIETEPESIKDNHIYVFTYENEIYCKYLCRNLKEIIIRSANSLYNDVFLVGEERAKMKILGEVVAVIRDYTR